MADGSKFLHTNDIRPGSASDEDMLLPDIPLPRDLPDEPVAIADMAEIFGVTHRTLHFYEEKGLINARRVSSMRVYDRADIARMALINACREVGMPIAGIQDLMDALRSAGSREEANGLFEEALLARRRELTAELSTIHRQLQQINALLTHDPLGVAAEPAGPRYTLSLSETERRCLQLMAEGCTPLHIARTLALTSSEIANLEATLVSKLDAHNRFQAIAKAVLLGIVAS